MAMNEEDPIEDLKRYGIHLEPDLGPTPYHRRIVATEPLPGTRNGHLCTLECGHMVQTFGKLSHARGRRVLCTACRGEIQIFKVQRPIQATPGGMRIIYVYNQDRSLTYQSKVPVRVIRKLFPDGEYKVFRYGQAAEGGVHLNLGNKAPWQEW